MFTIDTQNITLEELHGLNKDTKIEISEAVLEKVNQCYEYLQGKLTDKEFLTYGINTGFGALHNIVISQDQIEELQENLVKSHACGMGSRISPEIVKWMLFLKIQNICLGHSAVRVEVLNKLVKMYNEDIIPVVYEQGSLGASGDLAPLAHLSLPLLGLGEVYYNGRIVPSHEVSHLLGDPIKLKAKEGLALLNGTQFMNAHAIYALVKISQLQRASEFIAAISIDAYQGKLEPFHPLIHTLRKQEGQIKVAAAIKKILDESPSANTPKKQTQDPYSFRCIPQVHGACYDAIAQVREIAQRELNAVTDNPLIFPEEDLILSGGNFHGETLAIQLDLLAIALSEMANISERRIYKLIHGDRGLPEFLVEEPGLNSGLMIAQYTAAGIVSQNKQLCTPASVDSIVSSNGQEDHVSMGANSATKMAKVLDNCFSVLGIEFICASQAMSFRSEKTAPVLEDILADFRKTVPLIKHDRILHYDMQKAKNFIEKYQFPA